MRDFVLVPVKAVGIVLVYAIVCSGGVLWSQRPVKQVECSGTIVDSRGRPVAGAEVVGAEQLYEYAAGRIDWGPPSRTTTGAGGRFQLRVDAERRDYVWVVGWKKGLALGWQCLRYAGDGADLFVRLDEPAVLAGAVVDENGRGIAGATVRICLKMEWMGGSVGVSFQEPREWCTARTDEQGRFRFDHIPAKATADFWAQASGRAACWTYWENELSDLAGSRFKAGQTDVRIVLKPEAILRGRVIDENSGKGVADVRLLARPNARYANYSCVAPVTSGPDGVFVYRELAANDYSLQVVAPQDRPADWVGQDVKVTAQAGRTVDVNVPVGKGGLIEMAIEDAATGKPVENAVVNVSQPANFGLHPCWYHSVYSDAEGLARLRVPAGQCRMGAWAQVYQYFTDPEPVAVARGAVVRRQVRLDPYVAVTGIVHDPNGQPAAGAIVSSKPVCEEPVRSDGQGQFKVMWRPNASVRTAMVLARDPNRNLAGLAEVLDQSKSVDVTLAPAHVLRGRITDPNGKPISGATASLRAAMPGWLTNAAPDAFTDVNGVYEVRAVPAPRETFRYELEVHAQGYGPTRLRNLPFETTGAKPVEVQPIALVPADRSISGVIVDANDAPAAGVVIFISGPRGSDTAGQPPRRTVSDAQGRFAVEGVCAGPLRIQAGFRSDARGMSLYDAQGGDRDVKIVLGRDGAHTGLKPLLGKPLPDWKDLIDLDPEQTKGKPILLCFFDMNQRPSRRCLDLLTQQADALKGKGIIIAAIQAAPTEEDAWKTWVQERGAKLPFGQIRRDAEKAKSAWGVQSLPWLILTDTSHRVRAEGFTLDDLDKLLKTGQ